MRHRFVFISVFSFGATLALAADAARMTFGDLTYQFGDLTYSEDGIYATATRNLDPPAYLTNAMHDLGNHEPSRIDFTMASRFDVTSFDIRSYDYYLGEASDYAIREICLGYNDDGDSYDYGYTDCSGGPVIDLLLEGFRNGSRVAALELKSLELGPEGVFHTVTLGSAFTNLSSFAIEALRPRLDPSDDRLLVCWTSPCSGFTIDNVTLAPVPLPGGLPLAAAALAALGLVGRRRAAARA